jgi:hypothetical protein
MHQSHDRVTQDFGSHPPTDMMAEQIGIVRSNFANVGHWIVDNVPRGYARENAMERLRESMMWCAEAIRCDSNNGLAGPELKS